MIIHADDPLDALTAARAIKSATDRNPNMMEGDMTNVHYTFLGGSEITVGIRKNKASITAWVSKPDAVS